MVDEKTLVDNVVDGSMKVVGTDKDGTMYFMAATNVIEGSQPSDDAATVTETSDDRSVRIHIDRSDDGCIWAYENDVVVFRSVERKASLMNNGYDVVKGKDTAQSEKAKEYIEEELKNLNFRQKYKSIIVNREILGWAPMKKTIAGDDIIGLVELEPKDCSPIRNLSTGELGGAIGKGLNPDSKDIEVALVQNGNTVIYDAQGNPNYGNKYFYFTREEIMFFTLGERGKFKSISPVKRVLRLIESKKTIENIIELVCRRYGPQIWVIIGNESVNLTNVKIPQKFYRTEGGNSTGDAGTAMELYRKDIFSKLATNIKRWSTGETLAMMAEYGVDIKVINPSSNLPRYIDYIEMFGDFIKNGIFGFDFPGRVDVTSSRMLERLPRDLEDSLVLLRDMDFAIFNAELIIPLLKQGRFAEGSVKIVPKPIDRLAVEREVEVERLKSATIFNYARSGITNLPKELVDKWGFDLPDLIKIKKVKPSEETPIPMMKDEQHPPIGKPGPIDGTSR